MHIWHSVRAETKCRRRPIPIAHPATIHHLRSLEGCVSTATACAAAAATAAVILGMLTLAKAIALTDEARCVVEATPPLQAAPWYLLFGMFCLVVYMVEQIQKSNSTKQ